MAGEIGTRNSLFENGQIEGRARIRHVKETFTPEAEATYQFTFFPPKLQQVGSNPHAQINRRSGVRQRPNRDKINPGLGVLANRL